MSEEGEEKWGPREGGPIFLLICFPFKRAREENES